MDRTPRESRAEDVAPSAVRREPAGDSTRRSAPPHAAGVRIQAKLAVGRSDDPAEHEADRVAHHVVRALQHLADDAKVRRRRDTTEPVGARPVDEVHDDAPVGRVRRRADASGAAGGDLDRSTADEIRSSRGGGRPLPDEHRTQMESAFGADFGHVRVHEGARAADLNEQLQAKAFAVGNDIYFRDGLPDADSSSGRHLLAHELTHTIQQTGRVQRRPAISQRAGGPVIRRVGDAKSAWTRLGAIKTSIEGHTAEGKLADTTTERREELRREVASLVTEAERLVADAEGAKDYNSYRGPIKQLNEQIPARARTFTAALDSAQAETAIGAATVIADNYAAGLAKATTACQGHVDAAYAGLRAATTATTEQQLAEASAQAAKGPTKLAAAREQFMKKVTATRSGLAKMHTTAAKVASGGDRLAAQSDRTETSITKMLAILGLFDRDAAAAVDGVRAIEAAGAEVASTEKLHTEATARSAERAEAVEAAERTLAEAEQRRDEAAARADEAERLAREAADLAAAAAAAAREAAASAAGEAQRASALSGSLAFYEKHASRAPSSSTDDIMGNRRAEAASARESARQAAESSTLRSAESERQGALAETATVQAAESRSGATEAGRLAGEAATTAERERLESTAADRSKADAARGAQEATERRGRTIADQTASADAHDGLAVAVPDAFERAQLRLALGDASTAVLVGRGIPAATLLGCLPTVQSMIGGWGAAGCGDVVVRMQVVNLVAAPLIATFHQKVNHGGAVTAARACEVLDCSAGTPLDWFVPNGVTSAVALLAHGWTPPQVRQFLVAAKTDAGLDGVQTSKVCTLVTDTALPVADAVTLLKSEVTGTFLVTNALEIIRRLLTLPVPWTVDHISQLVKAAGTGCAPSRTQLATFCDRVAADALTPLRAIAVMKGAKCTAAYFTDVAYVMIRDAVIAGWTEDEIKIFVEAAATKAKLTKVQIERMYQLVQANAAITRANAALSLARPGVGNWTTMMNQVDAFITDGNLGTPVAIAGNHSRSKMVGVPPTLRVRVDHARVVHFVEGHTYQHYVFSSANIYRGNGAQPSSMWAVGTTAADVRASAVGAIQTAGPIAQAFDVQAGAGSGAGGTFDQVDYAGYCVGVQYFAPEVSLMQFFPFGANQAASVPPQMMDAIGHLFNGGI